jgi:hypothetical protein
MTIDDKVSSTRHLSPRLSDIFPQTVAIEFASAIRRTSRARAWLESLLEGVVLSLLLEAPFKSYMHSEGKGESETRSLECGALTNVHAILISPYIVRIYTLYPTCMLMRHDEKRVHHQTYNHDHNSIYRQCQTKLPQHLSTPRAPSDFVSPIIPPRAVATGSNGRLLFRVGARGRAEVITVIFVFE